MAANLEELRDVDELTRAKLTVRAFVIFSARNPQLHRIITQESKSDGVRMDYLVERRGFAAIRTYFASFRRASDRRKNFDAAFGESLADFEADVLVRLKTASAL